jgi:hypothetical protein
LGSFGVVLVAEETTIVMDCLIKAVNTLPASVMESSELHDVLLAGIASFVAVVAESVARTNQLEEVLRIGMVVANATMGAIRVAHDASFKLEHQPEGATVH